MATSVPVPFADIGKATSDLLGKDFPVGHTKLELKTVAPNGVVCVVKGERREGRQIESFNPYEQILTVLCSDST
jgi:hypothetical protein